MDDREFQVMLGKKFSQIEVAIDSILDTLEIVMPNFRERFEEVNYINSVAYLQRDKRMIQSSGDPVTVLKVLSSINTLLDIMKKAEISEGLYDIGIKLGDDIWKSILEGKNSEKPSVVKVVQR